MGVEYSYYNKQNQTYFEMGKWYCWDEGWQHELSAVEKLMLSEPELEGELTAYCEDMNFESTDLVTYVKWLLRKLIEFRGNFPKEAFSWLNDSDDSDNVLSTCLVCKKEYLCRGDKCACPNPTLPKLVGTRFMGDNGEMLYMENR